MSLAVIRVALVGALLFSFSRVEAQAPARLQVGLHGGFDFGEGDVEDERVGVQASIPLFWLLTANPAFSYLYNWPDDPTGFFEGSAWQGYLTVRVHPFGGDSFLGVGYGFTLAYASLRSADGIISDSDTDATDVGVIALSLPSGRVRPFAELYLIDLLERRSAVGANLLFGVNLRFP
jgi:hypothetical protein